MEVYNLALTVREEVAGFRCHAELSSTEDNGRVRVVATHGPLLQARGDEPTRDLGSMLHALCVYVEYLEQRHDTTSGVAFTAKS